MIYSGMSSKEHTIAGEEELRVIREFTQKPYLESQK